MGGSPVRTPSEVSLALDGQARMKERLKSPFKWIWGLLTIIVFLMEAIALYSGARGDTLSEQVWWMVRHSRVATGIIGALLVWLLWHFIIEPRFFPGVHLSEFKDDILIALGSFVLGWLAGRAPKAGSKSPLKLSDLEDDTEKVSQSKEPQMTAFTVLVRCPCGALHLDPRTGETSEPCAA